MVAGVEQACPQCEMGHWKPWLFCFRLRVTFFLSYVTYEAVTANWTLLSLQVLAIGILSERE